MTSTVRSRTLPYLLLAFAVIGVFLPSLGHDFTNWDDPEYVVHNPHIRRLDVPGLIQIFHPQTRTVEDWTPLVNLSHAIEYSLFELEPLPYHTTNILLHVGATLAVFGLMLRVGIPLAVAFGGALIFGIHPLQVESVVWISARKNLLSGLLGFATVLVYLRGTRRAHRGALALFVLACFSKGVAVVVPPLIVATLLLGVGQVCWRRETPRLAPFFLVALGRGLLTIYAQAEVVERTAKFALEERMAVMGGVLLSYLHQFLLPSGLRAHYTWPLLSWADLTPWAGWGLVLFVTGLVVWGARRQRWIGYLGVWVPVTLFPMLNIFPAPFFQADRYVYMSLAGVGGLAAGVLHLAAGRLRREWVAPTVLALWCGVVLTPVTLKQISVWTESYALWTYTLGYEPNWAIGLNNLGLWYHVEQEDLETAVGYYEQALAASPDAFEPKLNLAEAFSELDRKSEAEAFMRELITRYPDRSKPYLTLGNLTKERGQLEEAQALYRTSLELQPRNPEALTNMGTVLYELGRLQESLMYHDRAAQQDPLGAPIHNNRGNALRALGRLDEAAAAIRLSLELDPDYPAAYSNLGAVLVDSGRAAEAVPLFQTALELDPSLSSAASNLGNAYFALGDFEKALEAYDLALETEPDFPEALSNSGNTLSVQGHHKEAQARYRRAIELRPDFPQAKYGLGRSLFATGHAKEALPLLREAHEAMPGFPEAAVYLAEAAREVGELKLAAQALLNLIRMQPRRISAYQELARLFAQMGQPLQAEQVLRKALEVAEQPALLEQLATLLEADPSRTDEVDQLRSRARQIPTGEASPVPTAAVVPPSPATVR